MINYRGYTINVFSIETGYAYTITQGSSLVYSSDAEFASYQTAYEYAIADIDYILEVYINALAA